MNKNRIKMQPIKKAKLAKDIIVIKFQNLSFQQCLIIALTLLHPSLKT